jgi:2'-5' RNA ligase
MAKIAVDTVLLPSEEVMEKAIAANKELLKQYPDKIILNKENCLPHVSLAMGCIGKTHISDIGEILSSITEKYSPETLKFIGFSTSTNSIGEKVTVAIIEKTKLLQSLHEEVMTKLAQYLDYDITENMLLSEKVDESTLLWIKNFPENSSFKKYYPHITLGYGQLEKFPFPDDCKVTKLAMCHLGNHCTCRKILASIEL